jgi:hypothetical protein
MRPVVWRNIALQNLQVNPRVANKSWLKGAFSIVKFSVEYPVTDLNAGSGIFTICFQIRLGKLIYFTAFSVSTISWWAHSINQIMDYENIYSSRA